MKMQKNIFISTLMVILLTFTVNSEVVIDSDENGMLQLTNIITRLFSLFHNILYHLLIKENILI